MEKTLLIKNADIVVSCDENDRVYKNASVFIRNGVIEKITENEAMDILADEVIDAKGKIVYPGLINTHHHMYQLFTRNLPPLQNLELFPWLRALYEIWKNLDEETVMQSSLCAMGEMLKT